MFLGIDIGGTKCAVVLSDEKGEVIEKVRFATTNVTETIERILTEAKALSAKGNVFSCGISCGGPLDENKGIILSPPNLPGWDEIHIKQLVENEINVPCKVRNDANASAMAEYYFGAGKGAQNMVFLTFGTGLGAGIIINGKLYSGANGFAGEAGHIRLSYNGPLGYGKYGSFEGFCSGSGLHKLGIEIAEKYTEKGERPLWADKCDVAEMAQFARNGDKAAKEVFDICAEKLGLGLSIIVDLLNPERIVIGSVYARCRDLLEEGMKKMLKKEALPGAVSACEILPAGLGESIGDVAAIAVAREVYNELHR